MLFDKQGLYNAQYLQNKVKSTMLSLKYSKKDLGSEKNLLTHKIHHNLQRFW
jgi:hypothetical protein